MANNKNWKMNISIVDEGAYCGLYTNGKPSTNCHCKVCEEKEENYNND